MQCVPSRLILLSIVAGLLLAGCAHQPASRTSTVTTATRNETSAPQVSHNGSSYHAPHAVDQGKAPQAAANLPDQTGIPACDDYLSSYMACHRAAQIFTPEQLPARYEAMRTSLLRDSMNPDIRPQLAARCNSLATQLRQALHGKACAVEPAASSTAH